KDNEKENRYLKLLNQVIRKGVKTKVLMLSATPVNNRFNDECFVFYVYSSIQYRNNHRIIL
ncbi:hypothetical protein SASC598O11_001780, partial [Snodgrassella alvi SCGC AB-598-O11]